MYRDRRESHSRRDSRPNVRGRDSRYSTAGYRSKKKHDYIPQTSYSFPILSWDEILQCLTELEVTATLEDLEKAKPAFVKMVFENLAEHCMGITKEEINSPNQTALEQTIQFPELHEISLPSITFFRTIVKLMEASQISDFSILRDVIKPDPKRFRRNISAVINFAKFREERLIAYTELTARTDDLLDARQNLEDEQRILRSRIEDLRRRRESERPEISELEKKMNALEQDINDRNKKQAVLKYEAQELKKSIKDVADKIATVKYTTLNTQDETQKLSSQLVQSPERLQRSLAEMERTLEIERSEVSVLEESKIGLRGYIAVAQQSEKEVVKNTKILSMISSTQEKVHSQEKRVKQFENTLGLNEADIREYASTVKRLQAKVTTTKEKIHKVAEKKNLKIEAAGAALDAARRDYESLQTEYATTDKITRENNTKRKDAERHLRNVQMKLDAEKAEMISSYEHLKQTVDEYHKDILRECQIQKKRQEEYLKKVNDVNAKIGDVAGDIAAPSPEPVISTLETAMQGASIA